MACSGANAQFINNCNCDCQNITLPSVTSTTTTTTTTSTGGIIVAENLTAVGKTGVYTGAFDTLTIATTAYQLAVGDKYKVCGSFDYVPLGGEDYLMLYLEGTELWKIPLRKVTGALWQIYVETNIVRNATGTVLLDIIAFMKITDGNNPYSNIADSRFRTGWQAAVAFAGDTTIEFWCQLSLGTQMEKNYELIEKYKLVI